MKFCGWIDLIRGGVQCTWTLTLACLIFELLPFVYFDTWILSGAYLKNYTSYGYEILWINRSHQVGVHYPWTLSPACLIFELLPFVHFHSWTLSSAYLQKYTSYCYKILWVDRTHQEGVQCTWTSTLGCLIFQLLPFVYFHTWILSGAYLQNCTRYGYEIFWVDISRQGGVQCTWTLTLACLIFELLPFVYFHAWILSGACLQNYIAMVMKFCGWIDLIKGEGIAHELNSCLLNFWVIALCLFSYLNFVWSISPKTILAMVMKFWGWIDLIKGECSAHEPELLLT